MKKYNKLNPEVIVGLGERTEFLEKKPPFNTVVKLHIRLEDWLGDDLMECYPCYIVTESLKQGLDKSSFTGFEFAEMEVTKDEYFNDNYQLSKPLSKFFWLKINGIENVNDFYISNDGYLFTSSTLTEFITSEFNHNYLDIDKEEDTAQQELLNNLLERAKQRNSKL